MTHETRSSLTAWAVGLVLLAVVGIVSAFFDGQNRRLEATEALAASSANRIAALEAARALYDPRLDRIENKLDALLSERRIVYRERDRESPKGGTAQVTTP